MASANGEHRSPFRIGVIGKAEAEYLAITDQAEDYALEDAVIAGMTELLARLGKDPRTFGEPLFRLTKLRMMVRCGAIIPLHIEYGVHDIEPIVIIRKVRWLVDPATP